MLFRSLAPHGHHALGEATVVVGATLLGSGLFAQGVQAPPMTPILAGKQFTPPVRGQAEVEFTAPVTKREKDVIVTRIVVKNTNKAPIARLTIDETWYDKGGAVVAGGRGGINGLLQPDEIQTVVIQTPYNAGMRSNNFNFSHVNGTVKPNRVAKLDAPADKAGDKAAEKPAEKPAQKK